MACYTMRTYEERTVIQKMWNDGAQAKEIFPDASDSSHRCSAPGPRRGYTVSTAGRFLPYVPAWCPLMEANKKNGRK